MKKISKAIRAVLVAGLLSYGLFCQQANAIPITGSIIFAGPATASGPSGVGTTTISFTNPWTTVTGIGSYSSVTSGTPTTLTAFSFVGTGTTAMLSAPVMPEWTFTFGGNTYSFDLLSLSSGTTTSGSMAISGTGIAHITGFDATPASWAMEGAGQNFTYDLSSSTTASIGSIPDGGSAVSLLGIALVGLEALRRRLRSA